MRLIALWPARICWEVRLAGQPNCSTSHARQHWVQQYQLQSLHTTAAAHRCMLPTLQSLCHLVVLLHFSTLCSVPCLCNLACHALPYCRTAVLPDCRTAGLLLRSGALFKALFKWFTESGPVYLLPTGPVSSFLVISDPAGTCV